MTSYIQAQACASFAPEVWRGSHAAPNEHHAGGGHRSHAPDPPAGMMLYGANMEADIVRKAMERVQSIFQGNFSPPVLGTGSQARSCNMQPPESACLRHLNNTVSDTFVHRLWSLGVDAGMPSAAAKATTHQPASTLLPVAAACTPRPPRSGAVAEGTCCGDSDVLGEATDAAVGKVPPSSHC